MLEKHAVLQSPSQIEKLVGIFVRATKVRLIAFFFSSIAMWMRRRASADWQSRWRRHFGILESSDVM